MVAASPYDDIPPAGRPDCLSGDSGGAAPGRWLRGGWDGSWRNGLQAGKYGSEH